MIYTNHKIQRWYNEEALLVSWAKKSWNSYHNETLCHNLFNEWLYLLKGPHWRSIWMRFMLKECRRVQLKDVDCCHSAPVSYSKTHYDSGGYCLPFRKLKDYYEGSKRAARLLKKLLERSLQRHESDPLLIHVCGSERALVKDWLFDESIRANDPLADFYLEKKNLKGMAE